LTPLKREVLHEEPELAVYHDAFSVPRCKKVLKALGNAKVSQ
jgi:hypothetical protein